jgi:hypothetical protein
MRINILLFILLYFILLSSNVRSIKVYKERLEVLKEKITENKPIKKSLLYNSIPTNQSEADCFFAIDYSKDTLNAGVYRKIENEIVKHCINGNRKIFKRYLEFSYFVDGYFAEDYFISIKIIEKNIGRDRILKVLETCDKSKVSRIYKHYNE